MTPAELARYKVMLIKREQSLRQYIDAAHDGVQTVELDQSRVGRLSRMDALQSQALNQAAQARRETELRAVLIALKRIEQASFGDCQECDEPISKARLDANPAVTRCLACAS